MLDGLKFSDGLAELHPVVRVLHAQVQHMRENTGDLYAAHGGNRCQQAAALQYRRCGGDRSGSHELQSQLRTAYARVRGQRLAVRGSRMDQTQIRTIVTLGNE